MNNAAKRDIRPLKLMQKVAESFRSKVGTKDFTILRTVAETAANRDGTHLKPWEQERLT